MLQVERYMLHGCILHAAPTNGTCERCRYRKAYDACQQAVCRDARNPTFWCSIGVLYFHINQYKVPLAAHGTPRATYRGALSSTAAHPFGTL